MTQFVFVPGWACGDSVWDRVRAALPASPNRDGPIIAVGHSLGLLRLLKSQELAWDGLVSVNGFPRFTAAADFPQGIAPRVLERMRGQFSKNPAAVAADFLARCDLPISKDDRNWDDLAQGLTWLATWDERPALAAQGPMLVLAGRQDPIVPPAMTEAAFAGRPVIWAEDGGHALPLSHASWVAGHIRAFAETLLAVSDHG